MNRKRIRTALVGALLPLPILVVTAEAARAYPEPCAKPTVSIGDATGSESNDGTNTVLLFTVKLSSSHCYNVSVNYATVDGTAEKVVRWNPYGDYYSASGTVTIPAGATSALIAVSVNDDVVCEGDEYFNVTLSNAVAANISDGSATGTIATPEWFEGQYDCAESWS